LWLIARGSGGIPRLINIIAHKALISAYGRGDSRVNIVHVAKAISDTSESNWFGKLIAWYCRVLSVAASPALRTHAVLPLMALASFLGNLL
jgi:hypothetical protein